MMATLPKPINRVFQLGHAWWNYYQKNKGHIRQAVVDNVIKMLSCGLNVRGHAAYACTNPTCSHTKIVPFTCKARFCNSCGKKATANWIQKQIETLPKTQWQHITMTMPDALWDVFAHNRHLLNQLSQLAAQTIQTIAQKKGILPGIFTALHTFGRDLKWNVHIHLSVTRGGLNASRTDWITLFFKKKAIMHQWRYLIVNLIRDAHKKGQLNLPANLAQTLCNDYLLFNRWLDSLYQKNWIIHLAKPSNNHFVNINYLGRYIKRPPIAQSRLRHYDGNVVVFNFLNHKSGKHQQFTCSTEQFIERFTQHIPDKNFRLIRYYGFLANRVRGTLLDTVYALLNLVKKEPLKATWRYLTKRELGFDPLRCILCQKPLKLSLITVGLNHNQLKDHHQKLALAKLIFA